MPCRFIPRLVSWTVTGALLVGCSPSPITTVTVYDSTSAFVRLETDPTIEPGKGHTHPAIMSREHMAAVLRGMTIEEPLARLPVYDDVSQPRRHPALTEREVSFFAPLLSVALSQATPEEVVTFYETSRLSGTSREVTSGGLFVRGDELHLTLANYRSPTHYSADIGVADTTDDRLVPLRAIAPQRGKLDFEPPIAQRRKTRHPLINWFQPDKRELVILYQLLEALPATAGPLRAK